MDSYIEYFRQRLNEQELRLQELERKTVHIQTPNITGKKRKYEDALGYPNDYEVVQDPESFEKSVTVQTNGSKWVDAYLENRSN
jgi:hypothetical protein